MSTAPPNPSFSFTIPSLHDDIDLDCRIYNPPHSAFTPSSNETLWIPRGAVVAHPYAPLGGCYDDPIVLVVVEECLKKGLVVATFNFRYVQRHLQISNRNVKKREEKRKAHIVPTSIEIYLLTSYQTEELQVPNPVHHGPPNPKSTTTSPLLAC